MAGKDKPQLLLGVIGHLRMYSPSVLDIDRPVSVTETFYFCLVIRTDRRYSYMSFGGEEKKLQLSKATPDHHFHNTEPITG